MVIAPVRNYTINEKRMKEDTFDASFMVMSQINYKLEMYSSMKEIAMFKFKTLDLVILYMTTY